MKTYLIILGTLLISSNALAGTWQCIDTDTHRIYLSSQNVPSDRCTKSSDQDPTDAERKAFSILHPSDNDPASEARQAKEEEDRKKEMADELDAAAHSTYTCKGKAACSKAFTLAQVYVQQHSDQKIQVATDTIIDTYNPTEGGNVGITVTKIPRAGTSETITITPHCKLEGIYYESVCRLKRTSIYRGFRPFIEKSL
jgi:hypothetical protein